MAVRSFAPNLQLALRPVGDRGLDARAEFASPGQTASGPSWFGIHSARKQSRGSPTGSTLPKQRACRLTPREELHPTFQDNVRGQRHRMAWCIPGLRFPSCLQRDLSAHQGPDFLFPESATASTRPPPFEDEHRRVNRALTSDRSSYFRNCSLPCVVLSCSRPLARRAACPSQLSGGNRPATP